jgi:hypothetical protein
VYKQPHDSSWGYENQSFYRASAQDHRVKTQGLVDSWWRIFAEPVQKAVLSLFQAVQKAGLLVGQAFLPVKKF